MLRSTITVLSYPVGADRPTMMIPPNDIIVGVLSPMLPSRHFELEHGGDSTMSFFILSWSGFTLERLLRLKLVNIAVTCSGGGYQLVKVRGAGCTLRSH